MDEQQKKITIVSDGQLFESSPEDLESFIDLGWEVAKPEDIEFYGPTQKVIGLGEAVGRGVAGPLFTAAQVALGAEPKRIKKREEISVGKPLATGIELGSLILPGMAISKAASLAAKGAQVPNYLSRLATAFKFTLGGASELAGSAAAAGLEGQLARLTAKYGVENAIFSVADDVDEILLSDEPQDAIKNAQNVAKNAGLSFLIGAGTGAAFAGAGKVSELWKAKEGGKTARILEQARIDANPPTSTDDLLKKVGMAPDVPQTPPGPESIKSTQDLIDFVENLPPVAEVPREGRKIVEESMERLRLQNKLKYAPHEADLKALENKQYNDSLQTLIERGDKTAAAQIQHLQTLKKTMVDGLSDEIKTIAPTPVANKLDAGRKFLDITKKTWENWKNQVSSKFQIFSNVSTNKLDDLSSLSNILETKFPKITKYVDVTEDGILKLRPYDSSMPIESVTHQALKDVVKQMNNKDLTIEGLWNVHKNLNRFLKRDLPQSAKREVVILKKAVFDVIAENIQKIDPSIQTKELFSEYSKMKQYKETLEEILGGRLDAESYLDGEIVPELVLKNLMSDSRTMRAAKDLLGENWNTVLADIMETAKESATDKTSGIFSSANFKRFLEAKSPQLTVGFEKQENKLKNIFDYNTVMRAVPDKMPANPSRTAPTAFELGKQLLGLGTVLNPASAIDKAADLALLKIDEKMTRRGFDSLFKDKSAKPGLGMYRFLESAKDVSATGFQAMQDFIKQSAKGAYLTRDAIKNIFSDEPKSPVEYPNERSIQTLDKRMLELEQNPQAMLDVGGDLGYYLPEQDMALGVITTRVMQYLSTQRPGIKEGGLLNKTREPSKLEKQNYARTLQIAENPAVVLRRIKDGTLISKDVQDMQAMYPEAYNEYLYLITKEVVEKKTENQNIPFKVRKGISLFSGMPLDTSLSPQAIQMAQSTFQPQGQPQQPGLPQMAKKSSKVSKLPEMADTEIERRLKNR